MLLAEALVSTFTTSNSVRLFVNKHTGDPCLAVQYIKICCACIPNDRVMFPVCWGQILQSTVQEFTLNDVVKYRHPGSKAVIWLTCHDYLEIVHDRISVYYSLIGICIWVSISTNIDDLDWPSAAQCRHCMLFHRVWQLLEPLFSLSLLLFQADFWQAISLAVLHLDLSEIKSFNCP